VKDSVCRYQTMRGRRVTRKAGWDTHGLPVELEVEKKLKISGKPQIEQYGIGKFNAQCRESVWTYKQDWEQLSERIGYWLDYENPYVTYSDEYVESIWHLLWLFNREKLIYHGRRVLPYCGRCGTGLSSHELGQPGVYRDVQDPSVTLRFRRRGAAGDENESFLAWTTTPWTLPSNAFAAVKPDVAYAVVRDGEQRLIVAEARLAALAELAGRELPVERRLQGEQLVGRRYAPPFDWFAGQAEAGDFWRVVAADFVELDAGTGIVHIAPAFGELDFELLRREQQTRRDLPLLCAVRPDGSFDPALAPKAYAGRWVKDCDRDLCRELKERALVWQLGQIRHEYPYCVRSDQDPLIQYARPAWYIRTTAFVEEALANNARVQWLPEHVRDGRFGDFLRNNVDWALSRERFWGTPLNVWINDETGALDVPSSTAEIRARNPHAFDAFEAARQRDPGLSPHLRVHKPWIDAVTWTRPGEPGVYRRVPEVIDAWFDSGSMPFAQWGHPHRGSQEFERSFPADFISEAIDQTRGWFNSLLWISTLLFPEREKPHPYKTCVVLGHVADREGKKESKSKGNYTPPEIILDRVRLELAVVSPEGEPPAPGEAVIAREDFEGLDLRGERAKLSVYRDDTPSASMQIELRPGKLPRRVIVLAPADAKALRVTPRPHGKKVLPREVPDLPIGEKLWVEDPGSDAPGADAFRWFFFASNPPWNPTRHSLSGVRAQQRELPLKLRNVYAFFSIYANIDGFDPSDAACRAGRRAAADRGLIDRWILSELALLNTRVIERMDAYRLYESTILLTDFVDALSNWWVRRNRSRFWAAGLGEGKLDAYWTLWETLSALARLLAPYLPYAAEEIWQNLVRRPLAAEAEESVHLCDYPAPDAAAIDPELSRVMGAVREIVSLGLQVRTTEKLRVRQPLSAAELVLSDPSLEAALREHLGLVRDELNVHEVHFAPRADDYVRYVVKPNFRALGPKVGGRMPALKAALAKADGAALLRRLERDGRCSLDVDGAEIALSSEEIAISLEALPGFAAAAGGVGVVVLRTQLDDALVAEGRFREVLNRVQTLRKELDLEYTGRIELTLAGAPELLAAVAPRVEELAREALAVRVSLGAAPAAGAHLREASIDGLALAIGLRLADGEVAGP
ncbi:MAG: class I tRNA ligase family protein, partial [Candidatus Limnocylindria bacterium]